MELALEHPKYSACIWASNFQKSMGGEKAVLTLEA